MDKVEQTRPSKQEFVYQEDREEAIPPPLAPPKLDGIIAHLTRECGGNVHDKGVVNVMASSFNDSFYPKNAADLGTDSVYLSKNEPNSWICYDFKERRVIPTSYSVRLPEEGGFGQPNRRSWVIEV